MQYKFYTPKECIYSNVKVARIVADWYLGLLQLRCDMLIADCLLKHVSGCFN